MSSRDFVGMRHGELRHRRGHIGRAGALVLLPVLSAVLGLGMAGCSSDGLLGRSEGPASTGSTSSSPSLGDRFTNFFRSKPSPSSPSQPSAGDAALTAADIDCPTVDVRPGASTFAVSAIGAEPSALSLRYQASFAQTARECKLAGNALTIRVGIEGRVVLGPAGGPGQFEIPVRYAVVQEGPEPKTIVTKLHWQSVAVAPGETSVSFMQIEEDLTFQMPRGNNLEAYVVYIGFDRAAVKEPEKKKPGKKPAPVARRAN